MFEIRQKVTLLIGAKYKTNASQAVWPDWDIFCTLGNHSKPLATLIFPKLPALLGNFYKCVKIIHFPIEIIFGQLL